MERRHPDQGISVPPTPLLVAEQYARRKLRLDQVPALLEEGLVLSEDQERYRRNSDAMPAIPAGLDNTTTTEHRARLITIRHALATGQSERARVLLADFRELLASTKPADTASAPASPWRRNHHEYLELTKEAGMPATPLAELASVPPEKAERFLVGDFEARDLNGKTWRLADLKGKVAYINVWTTWCGPCRTEMPGLQRLFEHWKDRGDRVVLTISADTHADLARQFIQEHKYSFPVVHGPDTAGKFFPPVYFPQNWMIDPDGKRLSAPAPLPGEKTLNQIDELASKLAAPRP